MAYGDAMWHEKKQSRTHWIQITAGALCMLGAPHAFAQSAEAVRDLTGTWIGGPDDKLEKDPRLKDPAFDAGACCQGKGKSLPLTPSYRKIRDAFAKLDTYSVEKNVNNLAKCIPPGVPGQMEHGASFEFVLTPGRVTIIHEEGGVRRIWTDGRKFPEHITPSLEGYSIGHWENDRTLVVQTRGLSPLADMFFLGPIKDTLQTKVQERFIVESAKSLEQDVTVEDPEIFFRPYNYKRLFHKVPGTFEVGCINNRDNGYGEVDLTPPADLLPPPPR